MISHKTRVMLLANDEPPYHVDVEIPIDPIIKEGSAGECVYCESSLKSRWFRVRGCIQPECNNYHKDVDPSLWERFKRKLQ